MTNLFRSLPSMDAVLDRLTARTPYDALPRPLVRQAAERFLDLVREEIRSGVHTDETALALEALFPRLTAFVAVHTRPHFRRVINATGVVVHTNLGRSLLAEAAVAAVAEAAGRYSNLEFDLKTGERGSRYAHVEDILKTLTGAEAALVVNNNAAAVLLVLDTLARGREVIVSRGQLVEIGGSFRIPEVMAKSGAILKEVGATNRTHRRDYENAITDQTAALLKVHTSNFRIIGFTKEVPLKELKEIGTRYNLPVIEDLGSGNLFDFAGLGLGQEPTVQRVVADGADVVSFSGDKVLGGPQAGIIVGKKAYIDRIKKNPLNRALRIDKMTLAALEATLRLYLDPAQAAVKVPTIALIAQAPETLRKKARRLAGVIARTGPGLLTATVRPGTSRVGGGAFPEQDLPTTLVAVTPANPDISAACLRERLLATDPPLVARIEDDTLCLDPRTLADDELTLAAKALAQALA
ncbi:L-seryl-tRNA(Sec) selenium transferase [Desulfolutivibrio sulfoxidireducens]|uniref:L-seryl-tRNA(Sec) selenium transferase n=1 Tax=Desulfolutivibrio sulfoxidireducens TaxID=2773299 RepID=UPI00159D041F|nr:L-seryl-tRNA(Sec) selenium transferase [Desulfolutivibrio sulfoxidireducens]QLA15322.1 L-seryl-tRNA(Sec) selenium transferase [Desulfolutivibrio sulfoxidireducens]QLA18900.1 L-seryl-tRNA(Sec) selenium transferase [Desulfolutivibrio sulfoxidireducens]